GNGSRCWCWYLLCCHRWRCRVRVGNKVGAVRPHKRPHREADINGETSRSPSEGGVAGASGTKVWDKKVRGRMYAYSTAASTDHSGGNTPYQSCTPRHSCLFTPARGYPSACRRSAENPSTRKTYRRVGGTTPETVLRGILDLLYAPLWIPLVCCHIKSFRRVSRCGEARARRRKYDGRTGIVSRGI